MSVEIHGYAIVSDDDRIADARGVMPRALLNDADWAYFQAELDRADLVVLQYPMWWHLPPAMMKGWFDRVLAFGAAYVLFSTNQAPAPTQAPIVQVAPKIDTDEVLVAARGAPLP